jgi:hypothetical protein
VEGLLEWVKQLADRQGETSPSGKPPLAASFVPAAAPRYSAACLRLELYLALYSAMAHLTAARPAFWTVGFPSKSVQRHAVGATLVMLREHPWPLRLVI